MTWDTVIGLEVHAQLSTQSKLFSPTATKQGAAPNTQTSFIDAGLPGVLPVLNQRVIEMAIQFGLAIDAEINQDCFFERKNYFYPDLPKGYQISQFQKPIVSNGYLAVQMDGVTKKIHIERAHLEEDAGKSLHALQGSYTGIDLNRAGVPLLEIVTSPCMSSANEAIRYLKTLHQLVRFLGICDGNMDEGSFRCDVNLSLKPRGSKTLGTKTELKNLNSFRFIEKAILYEQDRHQMLLEQGKCVVQETRLYCPDANRTMTLRTKENENDYRYFSDPDLLPLQISEQTIKDIKTNLPPLPEAIKTQLIQQDALSEIDVEFLLSFPANFHFYQAVKSECTTDNKTLINWLKGPYQAALNEHNLTFEFPPVTPKDLGKLLHALSEGKITANSAKTIFNQLLDKNHDLDALLKQHQGQAVNTGQLEQLIQTIIANHPQQVADYKAGKDKLWGFFIGLIMKETKGLSDPQTIQACLKKYLTM